MLLLSGSSFPDSGPALASSLEEGLRTVGVQPASINVNGGRWPQIDSVSIDLSRGRLPENIDVFPTDSASEAGIGVKRFAIKGEPVLVRTAPVQFNLKAEDVTFDFERNKSGQPILTLASARDGSIELQFSHADLETLVLSIGREIAAEHGIKIESAKITIVQNGERAVSWTADILARKMFVTAVISLKGEVEVNEKFELLVQGLACDSSGVIGSIACGAIRPQLAQWNGKIIAPMALFESGLNLRDLGIETGSVVRIHAKFSS